MEELNYKRFSLLLAASLLLTGCQFLPGAAETDATNTSENAVDETIEMTREDFSGYWGNDEYQKNQNYIHQLFRDLRQSLEAVGVEEIFERNNYFYSLNPEKLDCDYYAYLKTGTPQFRGEYMTQYSWAEETCGLLWRRKN